MLTKFAETGINKILIALFLIMFSVMPFSIAQQPVVDHEEETEMIDFHNINGSELVSINNRFLYTLIIDLSMVLLIILVIYYPNYKKLDTIFTFIIFNVVILLLTFVLNKVKISMGAAFGLFAVFSMLRYRTEGIDMKDMTYLFVFIALGLISGIQLDIDVLLTICGILFLIIVLLDTNIIIKREYSQMIQFERIEMIKPELRNQLIDELKNRTGLKIHRISIRELDYLKDSVIIKVYYYE
jgi:hypothetical protein